MANEITVSGQLQVTKAGVRYPPVTASASQHDQTGTGYVAGVQEIGTSAESIDLGNVTTPGWAYIENLDATNFVEIGADESTTFVPFLKLLAGEWAICPIGTADVQAKANTAAVNILYTIYER